MMKIIPILVMLGGSTLVMQAQTTVEMKEQAAQTLEKSDKAMNDAYQQLLKILTDEGKVRLEKAQKAWLAYREAQAGFDCHHLAGGTAEGIERLGSLDQLTRERTKQLAADFKRFDEMK